MDNKLSELSKPVAYIADCGTIVSDSDTFFDDYKNPQPIYSQEYVSALLEDNERVARDLVARNGEIEGLRKRAAELEAIKADASQVFTEIGNELGCNPDNESIMMAIDELKKRLATPVRLPGALIPAVHASGEPFMRPEPFGFYLNRDDVIKKLRAAGFTVEGEDA